MKIFNNITNNFISTVFLLISCILLLITFNLFNIFFFLNFNSSDLTNIIVDNQIYDEVSSYLIRPFIISQKNQFGYFSNSEKFFLKDLFSLVQNYLIFILLDYKKLFLFKNVFLLVGNIIFYYLLFSKLFKFSKIFSISSTFLMIITFSYTPFTYNYLFELINLKSTQLMTLARSEPPGNTNIAFLISILFFFYYSKTKRYILLIISLLTGFFSYFYTTLILVSFYNLITIKKLFEDKENKNKKKLDLFIINFFFFFWVLLILQINKNNFYIYSITETKYNDIKTFLICFFFIILNYVNLKFNSKNNSREISFGLIIFQTSFLICYYSHIVTTITLGGHDHFYYFSSQSYWITILNIIYFRYRQFNKIFPFLILILSLMIIFSQKNYINNLFYKKKFEIQKQINYRKDFFLTNFNKYEKYIVIDLLFLNHYNYYLKEEQNLKNYHSGNNPDQQLYIFMQVCKTIKLDITTCKKLLFTKSNYLKEKLSFDKLLFYNYLNIYNKKNELDKLLDRVYFKSKYDLNYNYIIINKIDFNFIIEHINRHSNYFKKIEQNETFLIYKINKN